MTLTEDTTPRTRAIIFARFSPRPNADESESNNRQIERCAEYCAAKGYDVVRIIEEAETSGGADQEEESPAIALRNRKGLLEALDLLEKGMVLVVRWRNRLSRDVYISEWLMRRVRKKGARIEAADEENGDTLESMLIRKILGAFSEYQRAMISVMTKRGSNRLQAMGRIVGDPNGTPYGWVADPDKPGWMKEEPTEQIVLAMVKQLRSEGSGYRKICTVLNRAGIRTRAGCIWSGRAIGRLIERSEEGREPRIGAPVVPPQGIPPVAQTIVDEL